MENLTRFNFQNIFHLICILATVGITSWCCYKYGQNKDSSVIDLIPFNKDQESPYPSISLCLFDPCLDEKLALTNLTCNDYYNMHLNDGKIYETLLQLDYDDFTINLNNHLLKTEAELDNGKSFRYYAIEHGITSDTLQAPYRSFSEPSIKCYTFVTPYLPEKRVKNYLIYLNKTFLPYLNQTGIAVSYQNQINLRNLQVKMIENYLNLDESEPRGGIEVHICRISRIKRRNRPDSPCNEEWGSFDKTMLETISEKLGCRHPHLNVSLHLPLCISKSEIHNFTWFSMIQNITPPCISLIDSNIEVLWDQDRFYHENLFRIKVQYLATEVHETLQVEE